MASTTWSRAVWLEGESEEEGVVPSCWVVENHVMWPVGISAVKAMHLQKMPDDRWSRFKLVKVKHQSATKQECDDFDMTTTAELSDSAAVEDDFTEEKRKRVKTTYPGFVDGEQVCAMDDLEPDEVRGDKDTSQVKVTSQISSVCLPKPPVKVINTPKSGGNPCREVPDVQSGDETVDSSSDQSPSRELHGVVRTGSCEGNTIDWSWHSPPTSSKIDQRHLQSTPMCPSKSSREKGSSSKSMSTGLHKQSRSMSHSNRSQSNSSRSLTTKSHTQHSRSRSPVHVSKSSKSSKSSNITKSKSTGSVSKPHKLPRSTSTASQSQSRKYSRSKSPEYKSKFYKRARSKSPSKSIISRPSNKRPWSTQHTHRRSRSISPSGFAENYEKSRRDRRSKSKSNRERSLSSGSDAGVSDTSKANNSKNKTGSFPLTEENGEQLFHIKRSLKLNILENEFQKRVLFLLTEIRDTLNRKVRTEDSQEQARCGSFKLHKASNMTELQNLEAQLQEPANQSQLENIITKIGGVDAVDHIRKSMDRCLNNGLMSQMNITGKHQKFAFGRTMLYKTITGSIQTVYANSTEASTREVVSRFLKYAPERAGGGGRMIKQVPEEENSD